MLGQRNQIRWPLFIGVAVLVLGKALALGELEHHRVGILALLGLGLAFSVLRPRPVAVAVTAGALLAVALAPHPIVLGVAVGLGACLVLLVLFFAIAAVLHARQGDDRERFSHARGAGDDVPLEAKPDPLVTI